MKRLSMLTLSGLIMFQLSAQEMPGLRSGNYSGVNGVFANPASIADSRYKFDINLFSLSTIAANDQASFSVKNFSSSFKGDSLRNQVFGKDAGPASGMFQLDFRGPSAMFNVGRNSFALTTRARVFASILNMDGKLIDKISEDFGNDASLPYTISSDQDMRMAVNGWTEFGVSYGREIMRRGQHYLKGGLTLKYLAGAGNAYINIKELNGTIDQELLLQDAYLRNTSGTLATGFGGINFSQAEIGDIFKMNSTGIGADLGFIYEFRPGGSAVKNAPYLFKVGVAALDLGSIHYEKDMQRSGSYDIDITGNERLYLSDLENVDMDDYNSYFKSRPNYFTPSNGNGDSSYRVSLPSTLQIDADYHIHQGFYVNMATQLPLGKYKEKQFNNRSYMSMTLTPRFETKRFGFYLPMQYNELTKLNAGAAVRFGPLFLGSGSIVSSLLGKSKQADLYLGFRIGFLKK